MKILITYSSPVIQFEETVLEYKDIYKNCNIYVLASEKVLEKLKEVPYIDGIISFKGRFFHIIPFLFKGLWEVRRKRFDEVIILYNNPSGGGYLVWELMAFMSGVKKITTITPSRKTKVLKLLSWIRHRCFVIDSVKLIDTAVAVYIFICWFTVVSLKKIILRKREGAKELTG